MVFYKDIFKFSFTFNDPVFVVHQSNRMWILDENVNLKNR